jgi:hypothetical protein
LAAARKFRHANNNYQQTPMANSKHF